MHRRRFLRRAIACVALVRCMQTSLRCQRSLSRASTVTDVTCRLPCSACAPSVCEPRVIARGRRTAPSLVRGGRRSRLRLRSKTCIVRTPPHAADTPQRTKTCILRMPPHALRLCGRGKGCGLDAEQYRPPLCQSGCTTGEDPARLRVQACETNVHGRS